jgi:hypothetical protein
MILLQYELHSVWVGGNSMPKQTITRCIPSVLDSLNHCLQCTFANPFLHPSIDTINPSIHPQTSNKALVQVEEVEETRNAITTAGLGNRSA